MEVFYLLDALIFEHTLITTFEILYEGLGYQFSTSYFFGAFLMSYLPKTVLDHKVKLSNIQLGIIITTYLIGYFLYRASNSQKDTFRQNPYHPKVARKVFIL